MRGGRIAFACSLGVAGAALGCGRSGFDLIRGADVDAIGSSDGDAGNDATSNDATDATQVTLVANFTLPTNTAPPSARRATGAAVASDDRIWIFGGFVGGTGAQNTVASYTPGTGAWATVTPTGTPTARERHVLGWDALDSVVVLFSGYTAALSVRNELYVYNPTTNAFAQVPMAGNWPAARKDASMVWVPSLGQFLVYGGNNGSGTANRFSDLWLLSIDAATPAATWTLLTPGGVSPPAQSAPCVGFDPAARRLIVYGGETQDGTAATTTYQYLLDTNVWQLDSPTGTSPSDRAFSNCAWDPGVGRLVLYGGQNGAGTSLDGTFLYDPDAKRWDMLALAGGSTAPGTCGDGGAAYSASLGGVYVFGGRTGGASYTNRSLLLDIVAQ